MLLLSSAKLSALEWTLLAMRRAASRRRTTTVLAPHLEMGERGEEAALFHLRREGFAVVARRWRNAKQRGDLDLIAWEGDTLCFVEVKTRSGREVASAESAVDEEKRRVLRRLGRFYVKSVEPPPAGIRFDVLAVYFEGAKSECTLFRAAFDW